MKGLICEIYAAKAFPDCSNGGISGRVKSVTLVGYDSQGNLIPEIFDETSERPAVWIEWRKLFGDGKLYPCARPAELGERQGMMGGAYIYTMDSRFPWDYPVPLHDRIE